MEGVTRRRFLGTAAAAAGAAGLGMLPESMRKALAATPPAGLSDLRQVEHVLILMQENRSFDHYFGTLSGVRGFDNPDAQTLSTGRSVLYQPDAVNPDGYTLPFHLDTTKTNAAAIHDVDHGWPTMHKAWNGGKMDGWMAAQRASVGAAATGAIGYYTRADLPFHYALADAFTICDNYHCSVMGPTWPNRLHAITGTLDPTGTNGGPNVATNVLPPGGFTWTTYPERLQAAGISWRSYASRVFGDGPELSWFRQFQTAPVGSPLYENGMRLRSKTAVMDDIRSDSLPQVSWIQPESDEHPPGLPAAGAEYMYNLLDALAATPEVWNKTVLFITYDENGGFFDHVAPPTPPPGTPGEFITATLPSQAGGIAGPIGLGFRVPMFVISPWSQGGWLAGETFDHTSILRFLEARFGVAEPNISAWRRRTVGDLTSALRFPRRDVPFPKLADPAPVLAQEQQEVATLPVPTVPSPQSVPHQEPGSRPRT